MRQSSLTCQTLRQAPSQVQYPGQSLLVRAGYMEGVGSGLWAYMPLLVRSMEKVSTRLVGGLTAIGFQQVDCPVLEPIEAQEGRGQGDVPLALRGLRLGLTGSSLNTVRALAARFVRSHRDLPRSLFCLRTAFSAAPRQGSGLLQAREYAILDAYSLHPDAAGLEQSYERVCQAFWQVLTGISLPLIRCQALPGGGEARSDLMAVEVDQGQEVLLRCPFCGYAATQDQAVSALELFDQDGQQLPKTDVHGPGLVNTRDVAQFLGIPVWKTTKTILFLADGRPVAVMVRGDCDVNEAKVQKALGCISLELMPDWQVRQITGADVGYAGPIGLPADVVVIADHYVGDRVNFECGANRTGYHTINVNFARDLPLPRLEDLKMARPGHLCGMCARGILEGSKVLELAHMRALAPVHGCQYADPQGRQGLVHVGRYTVGISRLVGLLAELFQDQAGLRWPPAVAPYQVHLIGLNLEDPAIAAACQQVYEGLLAAGIEVLYDDRPLRAGQKFADSDLMGLPIRLTVSKRTIGQAALEFKQRSAGQGKMVDLAQVVDMVRACLDRPGPGAG